MDIFHTACVARSKVIMFILQFPLDVRKKNREKKKKTDNAGQTECKGRMN